MATQQEVGQLLMGLSAVYTTHNLEQTAAMLYAAALADVPIGILQQAVMRHMKASRFFPTPAELLEASDAIDRSWRFRTGMTAELMLDQAEQRLALAAPQVPEDSRWKQTMIQIPVICRHLDGAWASLDGETLTIHVPRGANAIAWLEHSRRAVERAVEGCYGRQLLVKFVGVRP